MRHHVLSIATMAALMAAAAPAIAQTTSTTTTTWTDDQGAAFTQYSTSQKYASFNDPAVQPNVGYVVPGSVTVYPLPATIKMPDADQYSYTIINNRPVVVQRTTRKVVHTWN